MESAVPAAALRALRVEAGPAPLSDSDTMALVGSQVAKRSLTIEIVFEPGHAPVAAWEVVHDSVTGPQRRVRELEISPFGVVQLHLSPAPPGTHGIAWSWD